MQPFHKIFSELPISLAEAAIEDVPNPVSLFPEEEARLTRAVEKRRREFSAGRFLARKALSQLGIPECGIDVGFHREPLWPAGVVGSITHCNSWCAAAVGRAELFRYIGIDVEDCVNRTLSRDLVENICVDEEKRWLATMPPALRNRAAMAVFSAKESLFKALFPAAREFLGFSGAQIIFGDATTENWSWSGRLQKDWLPFFKNDVFEGGKCFFEGPYVATSYVRLQTPPYFS